MRLFFAVNFTDTEKDSLMRTVSSLHTGLLYGSYTRRDNLHLTLAFIGELERARLGDAVAAADAIRLAAFDFTVGGAGRFGDLIWLGVSDGEAELRRLSSAVSAECRARKVPTDAKPFSPHLTVVRRVEMKPDFLLEAFSKGVKPLAVHVRSFELMLSERTNGVLKYTPVYSKKLKEM